MQNQAGKRLGPVDAEGAGTPLLKHIGNNPRMVAMFSNMTQVLVKDSGLPPNERWLVTLRMAWRCNCQYDFGSKAAQAATPEVARIAKLPADHASVSPGDRLLMTFTDQMHDRQNVDQQLWDALAETRSPAHMVELASLAGLYLMCSSVANFCGVTRPA